MKPIPFKRLDQIQLKAKWRRLGRRALRLWKLSGGLDPEIDALFKRMDAVDKALAKLGRPHLTATPRQQRAASPR